jgi:hypothetical protein
MVVEIKHEGVDWIQLALVRIQWWAFMSQITNLKFPKGGNFLTSYAIKYSASSSYVEENLCLRACENKQSSASKERSYEVCFEFSRPDSESLHR